MAIIVSFFQVQAQSILVELKNQYSMATNININNSGDGSNFFSGSGSVNIGIVSISNDSNEDSLELDSNESWKEQVNNLVTSGLLREALTLIDKSSENKTLVVQILSRLNMLEKNIIASTISKKEERIEYNNIVEAIMLLTSLS